ncbi:hypothetical protein PHLGIDRAFT_122949 [Phlebiopsis gigantea 11061_1 CR5-6]|uniref:Luciferase domain-containing protein n=1 Tax=Phlebiopsis gigantea (strain 11061_1 CR5-6) TaxID=745531 RepID=A0A0C3PAQ4_PHLG1|nr:hypothetical protein PHLGIDRAFT_122949 [Phlebiopsis gigantea 11061_1 CR5-6]
MSTASEWAQAFIQELVELNPAVVELVTQSPHERLNGGVMTNSAIHSVHGVTQAALLIERGWGERHQPSGSRGLHALPLPDSDAMKPARLPKEYIWIYAPRDVQELAVIKNILVAGVKYMTESKDIVVPHPFTLLSPLMFSYSVANLQNIGLSSTLTTNFKTSVEQIPFLYDIPEELLPYHALFNAGLYLALALHTSS